MPLGAPAGEGVPACSPQGSAGDDPAPLGGVAAAAPRPVAAPPVGPRWMIPTASCSLPMSTTLIVRSIPGWLLTFFTSSSVMYVAALGDCAIARPGCRAA